MFRAQWERRGFVIGHGIFGWLEAVDAVAGLAAATVGPHQELTAVRIGLVAVSADIVRDRGLEISAAMAGLAAHLEVLAHQRVLRLGVVKLSDKRALLPCGSAVAGFAALLELSTMGIVCRQAAQRSNLRPTYFGTPSAPGAWHFWQVTWRCSPVNANLVFEWSKLRASFQS